MSLDGHQKCSGLNKALSDIPKEDASQCQNLIDTAIRLGASKAKIISSSDIKVEEGLASLCNGDLQCENFGLSLNCPPHVPGPVQFRKWREKSVFSIVVKIELPLEIMFSSDLIDVMKLLHEIVAGVEHESMEMGYDETKSFAGGSCKKLFCHDKEKCCVVSKTGKCRYPESARPSMSGFGINVGKLMQSAGWELKMTPQKKESDGGDSSWIAGLILISKSKKF